MEKILIVEDEPLLCEAYEHIIKELVSENRISPISTTVCNSQEDAVLVIKELSNSGEVPMLCILDFRLKSKLGQNDFDGIVLGQLLRTKIPQCKILALTSIFDHYVFHTVINDLRPSGFILKSETSFKGLKNDIDNVLSGKLVYSKSINDFIKKSPSKKMSVDDKDLEILHLLSKGLTLIEVGKQVGLSLSGVEYRKRKIAEKFGIQTASVPVIVDFAKNKLKLI